MDFNIKQRKIQVSTVNINTKEKIIMPKLPLNQLKKDYAYWRINKPQTVIQRREVYAKCNKECFLIPEKLKYPICSKHSCNVDCKGMTAAAKRAFLVFKNSNNSYDARVLGLKAYKKVHKLGISHCSWA
jgi:hypothetical protein